MNPIIHVIITDSVGHKLAIRAWNMSNDINIENKGIGEITEEIKKCLKIYQHGFAIRHNLHKVRTNLKLPFTNNARSSTYLRPEEAARMMLFYDQISKDPGYADSRKLTEIYKLEL